MANKKEVVDLIDVVTTPVTPQPAPVTDVVPKAEYDKVAKELQRVSTAYNKLLQIHIDQYAQNLTNSIFAEIDSGK